MLEFNKKTDNEHELPPAAADRILQKVFEKTRSAPNTIPLDVLTSYSNYRKDRYALQRTVLSIVLLLFLLLPLLFVVPKLSVGNSGSDEYTAAPSYSIEVDSMLPIRRINVSIDGKSIPIYEVDTHKYSVEPTVNGTMTVVVTLVNYQRQQLSIEVNNVDVDAPKLLKSGTEDEFIKLYLADEGSGIDYEAVRGTAADGSTVLPVSIDKDEDIVIFKYPQDSMNVYIPDRVGNTLQLVMTIG